MLALKLKKKIENKQDVKEWRDFTLGPQVINWFLSSIKVLRDKWNMPVWLLIRIGNLSYTTYDRPLVLLLAFSLTKQLLFKCITSISPW